MSITNKPVHVKKWYLLQNYLNRNHKSPIFCHTECYFSLTQENLTVQKINHFTVYLGSQLLEGGKSDAFRKPPNIDKRIDKLKAISICSNGIRTYLVSGVVISKYAI